MDREKIIKGIEDCINMERADYNDLKLKYDTLLAENAKLREQNQKLMLKCGNEELSSDAISLIREMLLQASVPLSAFIDDHVGNLISMYQAAHIKSEGLVAENAKLRERLEGLEKEKNPPLIILPDGTVLEHDYYKIKQQLAAALADPSGEEIGTIYEEFGDDILTRNLTREALKQFLETRKERLR